MLLMGELHCCSYVRRHCWQKMARPSGFYNILLEADCVPWRYLRAGGNTLLVNSRAGRFWVFPYLAADPARRRRLSAWVAVIAAASPDGARPQQTWVMCSVRRW